MTREIALTQGKVAIVDDEDYARVASHRWHFAYNESLKGGYACTYIDKRLKQMHRFLLDANPDTFVDHANRDTLDNRRSNLRLATAQQNACNRRKKGGSLSKYIGVYQVSSGRWRAYVYVNRKRINAGYFEVEIEAALAHDRLAIQHHGAFASLNFPHFGDIHVN